VSASHREALCPSADAASPDSLIIGVVTGTASEPRLGYLERPQPATPELLALARPATPAEVFRFSSPCVRHKCPQFRDEKCQIGSRMVQILPQAVDRLPACGIRPRCRWWQQEAKEACLRCPLIVTDNYSPSTAVRKVAGDLSSLSEEPTIDPRVVGSVAKS
jgi:hypothetical protein